MMGYGKNAICLHVAHFKSDLRNNLCSYCKKPIFFALGEPGELVENEIKLIS